MRRASIRRWSALALLALSCGGEKPQKPEQRPAPAATGDLVAPPALEEPEAAEKYDLIEHVSRCEMEHRGRLLDLGTESSAVWAAFQGKPATADENITRDGATLLRTTSRELSYDFWLDEHGWLDAGLTQNRLTGQAAAVGTAQGCADEVAGDGAFTHAGVPTAKGGRW